MDAGNLPPTVKGIDHLIVTTHALDAAAAFYANVLGLHVSGGGIHPRHGTMNRIIVLGDEYIELLGPQPGASPSGPIGELLRHDDGFAACILGVDDPVNTMTRLSASGMSADGPVQGSLDAGPDFSRAWKTVNPVSPTLPGVPFLIKHDSSGNERRRLLAGAVGQAPHSLGAKHVASVTIAVLNLPEAADLFSRMLGLPANDNGVDPMLRATCASLTLPSQARIVLAAPIEPGVGPVATSIAARGEGTFAFSLAVDDLGVAVKTLRGRRIGVRVDEPNGVLVAAQLRHDDVLGARIGLVAS